MNLRKPLNSIYFKILVVYLITILPIYALFVIFQIRISKDINNERSEVITNYTNRSITFIENELARVYNTQQIMAANNFEITMLHRGYNKINAYQLGKLVQSINDNLWSIKKSSSLVDSVKLYIPAIQREVSTISYFDVISENMAENLYLNTMDTQQGSVAYADKQMLLCHYNTFTGKDTLPEYMICVQLSEKSIRSMLGAASDDVFWIIHNQDFQMSNDPNPNNAQVLIESSKKYDMIDNEIITDVIDIDSVKYIVSYVKSPVLNCLISYYTPLSEIMVHMQSYINIVLIIGICTLVGGLVLAFYLYSMLKVPLNHLLDAFRQMEKGNLDMEIHYRSNNEFGTVFKFFNKMLTQLNSMINQVYLAQINLKKAQLRQLQAQINPHFLYNSFGILTHSIMRNDNEVALSMANNLSGYFKYITKNIDEDTTLGKEFEFAQTYLNIQKIRFQNKIHIEFKPIVEPYSDIKVPRMILQPLIENCYKHGLKNTEYSGRVSLTWYTEDNNLFIEVKDNGCGINASELEKLKKYLDEGTFSEHDGLQNVNQRLKLKYGSEYGLHVESVENEYFKVTVTIPVLKGA